jgi:cell division protease FtsH
VKYETIDEPQITDIMEGREPRPPADWKDEDASGKPGGEGKPDANSGDRPDPGVVADPAPQS